MKRWIVAVVLLAVIAGAVVRACLRAALAVETDANVRRTLSTLDHKPG